MALIEFYGNSAGDAPQLWNGALNGGLLHRSGGVAAGYSQSWMAPNSSATTHLLTPQPSHIIMGCAVSAISWNCYLYFYGDGGAVGHLSVWLTSTAIVLMRGSSAGTEIGRYSTTLMPNNWYFIELEATISDTVGIAKVRLNGNVIIDFVGDTKNAGTAATVFSHVGLVQAGNFNSSMCDFYVLDDTGPAPWNAFLGDIRITKHRPSAAGNSAQFTPDTAVANYTKVNEVPYSAANYVSSLTSGHKDSYVMDDLPASVASVLGLRTAVVAKNPDGGSPQIKNLVRTNGTDYLGTGKTLGGSDSVQADYWLVNPDTGVAWTIAEINALEVGMARV